MEMLNLLFLVLFLVVYLMTMLMFMVPILNVSVFKKRGVTGWKSWIISILLFFLILTVSVTINIVWLLDLMGSIQGESREETAMLDQFYNFIFFAIVAIPQYLSYYINHKLLKRR